MTEANQTPFSGGTEAEWVSVVASKLVGKTITGVSFMSQETADDWGWSRRPLQIDLSDGHQMLCSRDDEGNNGGSLFTTYEDLRVIPVL